MNVSTITMPREKAIEAYREYRAAVNANPNAQDQAIMSLFAAVEKDAMVSSCGRYRYSLSRCWDDSLPRVCWIALNPSTADASADDPTIRRCMDFSRRWGAGGIYVVNLFALRATDPRQLRLPGDPIGPDNDAYLKDAARAGFLCFVAAWGSSPIAAARVAPVLAIFRSAGQSLQCLGQTKDGSPRHPLYVRADTALVPFRGQS